MTPRPISKREEWLARRAAIKKYILCYSDTTGKVSEIGTIAFGRSENHGGRRRHEVLFGAKPSLLLFRMYPTSITNSLQGSCVPIIITTTATVLTPTGTIARRIDWKRRLEAEMPF